MDQQTLWSGLENHPTQAPLADRMRPRTQEESIGQEKLVGEGKLLRRAILADKLTSSIFDASGNLIPGVVETSTFKIVIADLGNGLLQITTTDKATGASTTFQISNAP